MPDRRWPAVLTALLGAVILAGIASDIGRAAETFLPNPPLTNATDRLQGTITWVDFSRRLIVVDTETNAVALITDKLDPSLSIGDEVELEGNWRSFVPSAPDFPENPMRWAVLNRFETPTNWADYSLSRLSAKLHPPSTGEYTFWIASDDSSVLRFGEENDRNISRIAQVDTAHFTEPRQWTRYPSQHSQPIYLEAGKTYYIEALGQNTSGKACLAVAWDGPGFQRQIISRDFLSPAHHGAAVAQQGVTWEYWTNFYSADLAVLTNASPYVLSSINTRINRRGVGHLPRPIEIPARKALDARLGFRVLELEGRVAFISKQDDRWSIELRHGSSRILAKFAAGSSFDAVIPIGSVVRVRGVFEPMHGYNGGLSGIVWVSTGDDLVWLDDDENWSAIDPVPQLQLTASNLDLAVGRIIRAQGRVSGKDDSGLWRIEGKDSFQGYLSTDGAHWSSAGPPVEIAMSNNVLVGFAINSHVPDAVANVEFDHVAGISPDFFGIEIGNPPRPGGFLSKDGKLTVRGSGFDIWGGADQCYFSYQPAIGNVELLAHLMNLNAADARAKAVLMVRESAESNAPWAGVVMMPGDKVGLQSRLEAGGGTAGGLITSSAKWIKLVRRRNSFFLRAPNTAVQPGEFLDILGRVEWSGQALLLDESRTRRIPQSEAAANIVMRISSDIQDLDISELSGVAKAAQRAAFPVTVRVRGVITFNDSVNGETMSFVQSRSGPARIQWKNADLQNLYHAGTWVELTGTPIVSESSTPTLLANGIASLGSAEMPDPLRSFGNEIRPGLEGRWAEFEGVVRSGTPDGGLLIQSRAGLLRINCSASRLAPVADLLNAVIRVRGVFLATPSPTLLLPSENEIEVVERPPKDPFDVPSVSIRSLAGMVNRLETARRLKVEGVITCRRDDLVILQDASGGIQLDTAKLPEVHVGMSVAGIGFPVQRKSGLALVEALLRPIAQSNVLAPLIISSNAPFDSTADCALISMEAMVLEHHSAGAVQTLDLQAGQRAFRASLPKSDGFLPRIVPGSKVRLTGVAIVEGAETRPVERSGGVQPLVGSLELLLRTPRDVIVIQRPPWWNWKYTVALCVIVALAFTGGIVWIRMLRRRVEERTRELRHTMDRLEKETRISATLAERDRLAGEIHDSVEQGLSAIVMQMEAAAKLADKPEEMSRYLLMAKNMASFSRTEVQHAVWDLQSPLLENADLPMALRRVAHEISAGDTPRVTVEIFGVPCPLPSAAEHHLLRIAQEAITNAVKHGNPRSISLRLEYAADAVRLTICDDGAGFVPEEVSTERGHFGLQGMRARAIKIGATFSLMSHPGRGTHVEIVLPCHNGPKTNH